jgi:DNA modification methylase
VADWQVIQGDFREKGNQIADESVDLIFTDPPYDKKTVPLYKDLAQLGQRVLKQNGSLLCYAGHYALPEIMNLMAPYLRYWWIISLRYTSCARLPGKWVLVNWKPILWFVKGGRRDHCYVIDGFSPMKPEKGLHPWQQPVSEALFYIEQLTSEKDMVLDPFMGSGTTGCACVMSERDFIGIDISEDCCNISSKRIAEVVMQKVLI